MSNLDPQTVANAQMGVNTSLINQLVQANRVGQTSPYGSTSYTKDANGNYTQNTTYSPEVQAAIDAQVAGQGARQTAANTALGQVSPTLDTSGVGAVTTGAALNAVNEGRPLQSSIAPSGQIQASLDTRGLPGIQNTISTQGLPGQQFDINGATMGDPAVQNAVQQSYAGQMQLLQPQLDQQKQQLQTQLMDQGIPQGSDAWNTAMANLNRNQAVQTQQALTSATQQGIGLQGQLFGQAATAQGAHNTAQATGFQESAAQQAAANQAQAQGFGQATTAGTFRIRRRRRIWPESESGGLCTTKRPGSSSDRRYRRRNSTIRRSSSSTRQTALTKQQYPLNVANALTTGQALQTPGMPSYAPVSGQGISAPNMGQLGLNQYNATTGAKNSKGNGLLSAGTSAAGSSALGKAGSALSSIPGALLGAGMGMV